MPRDPGSFRVDELAALDEFLSKHKATRAYTVDYPEVTAPLARAVARVAALLALAQAEQAAADVAGEDARLGPQTPEDDAARLQALADHAAAQGEGES